MSFDPWHQRSLYRYASERGSGRGRGRGRGKGGATTRQEVPVELPSISAEIKTVAVRRPGFGTAGRPIAIQVNAFVLSVPENFSELISFGLVVGISRLLPSSRNLAILDALQRAERAVFGDITYVYDGKKNLYSSNALPLGDTNTAEFAVLDPEDTSQTPNRPQRTFTVRLARARIVDLTTLHNFVQGKRPQDEEVLTGIMALNVVVRMAPIMNINYSYNVRSFFTTAGKQNLGRGLELWRGYFQSVRPTLNRILVNVDISTGLMYKPGPLIPLCLEFLQHRPNEAFRLAQMEERDRIRLGHFLAGLRVRIGSPAGYVRSIRKLTPETAQNLQFTLRDGHVTTVAQYFQAHVNTTLRFPNVVCVQLGEHAWIPLELCYVLPGQLAKKQVPPELMPEVLKFSTAKPKERLGSIAAGLETFEYEKSKYIKGFDLNVQSTGGKPLPIQGRILNAPTVMYGAAGGQKTIVPAHGSWNLIDKNVYQAKEIKHWAIMIYAPRRQFTDEHVADMIKGILLACKDLGIPVHDRAPLRNWVNGQGDIEEHFKQVGAEVKRTRGELPNLLFVVLPENGDDIWTKVKHYGDIKFGVATQCVRMRNCFKATRQVWANILVKVNAKLGGINHIPDVSSLRDPMNPTIIMGADVVDPPPGARNRASFASLAYSVDPNCAKYLGCLTVQPPRQQIIQDLYEMCKSALDTYIDFSKNVLKINNPKPKRLIFYRDGVSEGEYEQVLKNELPKLKRAFEEQNMSPKITLLIVGKRHHMRFFPQKKDEDRSGNCPAGTIVDRDISHPTDFDYYLQSHGGIIGTSRPAHYVVLHDENKFTADGIQALSYALCYVYARATRSVSIPAPVYYADIICSRARVHFDPKADDFSDDSTSQPSSEDIVKATKKLFKVTSPTQMRRMYFM
ncbi:Protein argonaute-2 [Hypsizygus marmoreus]|uniref:Protein argonaute-2 n=1 Tax=Hypsizygus marmoreus TaxID=39966 RepID=A0A369JLY7_HYPMA|nr:Protein argonaute-2 [Hypsizygus marmoreus]